MIKRALVVAVASLCFATATIQASQWWMPSPISIAITVGQWLTHKQAEVFYIRVQSVAQDERSAREEAFRLAINQAVGSLVVSERSAVNGELVRNEITNYSAGYVHDFEILEQRSESGTVTMTVDVWVAKSQIADRILGRSRADAEIEGGRISAQINTYDESRQSGDRVLESVLTDFPRRAFVMDVGQIAVGVNQQRQKFLRIPVTVVWDENYLRSLDEAVARTSHVPQCDSWLHREGTACRSKIRAKVVEHTGYYDDEQVGQLFERHMMTDPPRLLLTVLDSVGQEVYRDCWRIDVLSQDDYHNRNFFTASRWGLHVRQHARVQIEIPLALDRLPVNRLDRVEVAVLRQSACPK